MFTMIDCGCSDGHTLMCVFARHSRLAFATLVRGLARRWVDDVAMYAVGVWCYNGAGSPVWATPLAEYAGPHLDGLCIRGCVDVCGDVLRLEVR